MTAVMKGDGTSVTSKNTGAKQWLGRNARCWIVVARKLQRIQHAEIWMLLLDVLIHFGRHILLGYLNNLMSVHGISKCFGNAALGRICDGLPRNLAGDVFSRFPIFKVGCLNQMPWPTHFAWLSQRPHVRSWNFEVFWKRRSLADTTASSELAGDVFSRFRFSSWMPKPGAILADTFAWLSQRPLVRSWNFEVFWKRRPQADMWWLSPNWMATSSSDLRFSSWVPKPDAFWPTHFAWLSQQPLVRSLNFEVFWKRLTQADTTASSELAGDVFSRFRFSSWMPKPDAFWPTHLLDYLNNLLSVHGISKCFGNASLGRIRRLPQNWLATSSRDFDFQVGCLNQMPFWSTHLLDYLNNLLSVHGISRCFGNASLGQIRRLPQNWLGDVF